MNAKLRFHWGVLSAIIVTPLWVMIWASMLPRANIGMTLVVVGMGFLPGALTYLVAFAIARTAGRLLWTDGSFLPMVIATLLPSAVPLLLYGMNPHVSDFRLIALGFIPGGLIGGAIAFWPIRKEESHSAPDF